MGLSALSSPTNGLQLLDRSGELQFSSTPDDSVEEITTVWQPRPVDKESMARITQYFTEASRAANESEERKTSRSLGYLNIASETSTEDEFAAEVKYHNYQAAKSQPRLVYHVDHTDVKPTIVVDFRPIEPMPTSPSSTKPKAKTIGISPSRSLPKLNNTDAFVQEARELYQSHFGANPGECSSTEYTQPSYKQSFRYFDDDQTGKYISTPNNSSFSSQPQKVANNNNHVKPARSSPGQDKYKLRPTLQTPPFPTDLTMDKKLSVFTNSAAFDDDNTGYESVYDGANRSEVVVNVNRNVPTNEPQDYARNYRSSKTVILGEQTTATTHSQQSSHSTFGASKPDLQQQYPAPPIAPQEPLFPFRPVYVHSHTPTQNSAEQKKKEFSCCSLGREPHQQMEKKPQADDPILDTSSLSVPGSPNKKRNSRHLRSNSTPFPSPCNFIDLLADDPTTSRDPYNYYHVTSSQPSLAAHPDRASRHLSGAYDYPTPTSRSAGNIPQGSTTKTEMETDEKSATLGSNKPPKKGRYIKHKKTPSNHSFGAISGLSSSGTTLEASSGKSTETIKNDDGPSPGASLESRLQYFFRQQAAAEGLIPSPEDTLERQRVNSNLGVGQILPNLLSATGRGSSYTVTGEVMLGIQPGPDDQSVVLNVVKTKDIADRFIDFSKKREWHCVVSYQDYKKNRSKEFRSHAIKAALDPVFHEIFGFKINSLEGLIQLKLLCRKGIFSQKKKVGSIYLCLERIPFENYEKGELVAWYKLLRKR